MFGLYKIKNLYIVKIAKVTHIKYATLFEKGRTDYKEFPYVLYFAKPCKIHEPWEKDGFQLITNGLKIYKKSSDTEYVGDYFATQVDAVATIIKGRKYLTRKFMNDFEAYVIKESLNASKARSNDRNAEEDSRNKSEV